MSLYVLDTDTLVLWLHGQASVCDRLAAVDPSDLTITIITVDEILRGWYTQIRQAKDDSRLARAYESLQQAVEFTNDVHILPFDLPSIQRFHRLRVDHRRIGTNDLRIAAISLQSRGVLVTRNTSDFADIEGLNLENWA